MTRYRIHIELTTRGDTLKLYRLIKHQGVVKRNKNIRVYENTSGRLTQS
jgi:hypothetical protein